MRQKFDSSVLTQTVQEKDKKIRETGEETKRIESKGRKKKGRE